MTFKLTICHKGRKISEKIIKSEGVYVDYDNEKGTIILFDDTHSVISKNATFILERIE